MSYELTAEQRSTLRQLTEGAACPPGVASVLLLFADGKPVTSQDVYYCTRDSNDIANFSVRLHASGTAFTYTESSLPAEAVELIPVRRKVQRTARVLADAMDTAAELIASAEKNYAAALGW